MIEAFGNMFKIPQLRKKLLITVGLLVVCRIGVYVTIPGVDTQALSSWFDKMQDQPMGKALGLFNLFAGGAFKNCGIFGLGIMPYISASIIFQLLGSVIPSLERLQKEGEAGLRKINQYTRYATVGLCLIQGLMMIKWLFSVSAQVQPPIFPAYLRTPYYLMFAALTLTAGTMILMWLGEQIDNFGIGSGISLVITIGIVARMPSALLSLIQNSDLSLTGPAGKTGIGDIVLLAALFVSVVMGIILITQGQRRIPMQQAKHTRGRKVYGGQKQYLPLRVNQAGVIPIIFAQSLLMFPSIVFEFLKNSISQQSFWFTLVTLGSDMFRQGAFTYILIYVALIFFFCYFWTAIQFNPIEMANNLRDHGSFVPGIRPGRRTAEYLEKIMTRITLAGAAFLAVIAILPQIITQTTELDMNITSFFGGTGLLIVVGVTLDLVQRIEAQMMMRHYEGFMNKGRVKGRMT